MYMINGEDLDECLEVLADRNRRRIIEYVRRGSDGTASIDELADHLNDSEPISASGPRTGRYQFDIQLHHDHLPKLEAHGTIEYIPERDRVRYRPDSFVEAILDSLPEEPILVEA